MVEECRVKGKCNQCGDCCRLMCKSAFMLDPQTGYCRYLINGQGMDACAIHLMSPGQRSALPPEVQWYWNTNCDKFPKYLPDQTCAYVKRYLKKVGWPTDNCGYTVEYYNGV